MNGFRAFHPPIDSIESIGLFFTSVAKQLLRDTNYTDDNSFHRACWKLLNGALLGRIVPNSFVSLIQHICTAFLPLLARRPVARVNKTQTKHKQTLLKMFVFTSLFFTSLVFHIFVFQTFVFTSLFFTSCFTCLFQHLVSYLCFSHLVSHLLFSHVCFHISLF